MSNDVQIFVPGRLCLAGEHSDWAASYRLQCEDICTGAALVVTLQQGLSATATALPESLILDSSFAGRVTFTFDALYDHAKSTSLWRYAAGVAHVIYTRHDIRGGLFLRITDASLEAAKGLSSSAALCVLVASAYNRVYDLGLTIDGEMDLAYAGERLTGSLCGRMDQIVAIGPARMARMLFDGEHASHIVMRKPKKPIYVVVADLNASKDTAQILSGLQRAYPNGSESSHKRLRLVLGRENVDLIGRMQAACDEGDSERLGALMDQAQRNFDEAAIPFCPEQLESPVLHATLSSPDIQDLVYGGKGVGSQGDGAVQFVAKSKKHASTLVDVLKVKLGTTPFMVCIGEPAISGEPSDDRAAKRVKRDPAVVKTAVIPAAGFGTRLFPASRSIRPKALFPVIDTDGFAKPLILYLVEQCIKAGIEDVIIVVGPGEQVQRVKEIFMPVPPALYKALKPHMREYADRIAKLQHRVRIAIQHEPKGFGDAVACAPVEPNCPFALLLGDVAFRSEDAERSCLKQALRAFQKEPTKSVISVTQVPLAQAGSYGVVNTAKASLKPGMTSEIERIVEKPDPSAAEQLASEGKCNIVLGPYILTAAVMTQLTADVESDRRTGGEIQLTSALESILEKEGMNALLIDGNAMDTGNPLEYSRTISAMTSDAKAP